MSHKDERAASILQHSVGTFLGSVQEPGMMITVTKIETRDHERNATVFVTVYPESKEEDALIRLKREGHNLREHVREHEKLAHIPFFDFKIDKGEKNRQHIDEISGKL